MSPYKPKPEAQALGGSTSRARALQALETASGLAGMGQNTPRRLGTLGGLELLAGSPRPSNHAQAMTKEGLQVREWREVTSNRKELDI